MTTTKRYTFKKMLFATLWLAVAAFASVLLVAAMQKKDLKSCKKIVIKVSGIQNDVSVEKKQADEKNVLNIIKKICGTNPVGKKIGTFDLTKIEAALTENKWNISAELFFDNNDILKVNIKERTPVVRVFTNNGTSFYADTALNILPVRQSFSIAVPVFTNFPSDKMVLTKADSNLLREVVAISTSIHKDTFRMAMIEQVDITPQRNFEMIPKIGNQIIEFGDAKDIESKFEKLQLFYKEVMMKTSWNKYRTINVAFQNQVVAKRADAEDVVADKERTIQLLQIIASNAARQSEDSARAISEDNISNSTDSSIIQQSIQRDDANETTNAIIVNDKLETQIVKKLNEKIKAPTPILKPAVVKPTPVVKKDAVVNKPKAKQVTKEKPNAKPKENRPIIKEPKAVMQTKNDYIPAP